MALRRGKHRGTRRLGGVVGLVMATADEAEGPIFIASDQPLTEQQVREKLQSDGWMNIQILPQGRYFEITGVEAGRSKKIMVNWLTGRLIGDDDD